LWRVVASAGLTWKSGAIVDYLLDPEGFGDVQPDEIAG
jgi:hypothetical protein